jgi:uncharacterized protein YdhG (YjbR/CyaY superfamily)
MENFQGLTPMRQPKSEHPDAKAANPPKSVDEYLARVPEPARSTLNKVRAVIQSIVPAETIETISYQVPSYKYKGMLVGFAAFSDHCSLFAMNPNLRDQFKAELKGFRTSKGTIQFPLDKPLSSALLRKLVRARIAQNELKEPR